MINTGRQSRAMANPDPLATEVASLRSFNRLYTQRLGLLNQRLDGSPFPLSEARVLYELAHNPSINAAGISRRLGMDRAQLSRILAGFLKRRLLAKKTSPEHAKHQQLSLTPSGARAFAALNQATDSAISGLLGEIAPPARRQLLDAAAKFTDALSGMHREAADEVLLRAPVPGDIGWVIHRQASLYREEYGWDWTYEALIAGILADFIEHFDGTREQAWLATIGGDIVGSIFLKSSDKPGVAKLRLLYVEPAARGRGVGRSLVSACIASARAFGYVELELWTNSVLTSARRIYEAAGFLLREETPHHSFGHDLVGQQWALDLRAGGQG